ncbi:hypothetical protein CEXT_192821 [Caerostris extrusa]|uniref:Uncharacterized protein n=1 Tax=Caerostris extrusa TaxID=172846 RepID=A0AAV4XY74_CAEEX|nr:hypothetical protein CEXT_192821 [Caerostris extrusa]
MRAHSSDIPRVPAIASPCEISSSYLDRSGHGRGIIKPFTLHDTKRWTNVQALSNCSENICKFPWRTIPLKSEFPDTRESLNAGIS